jgi:hypothetical protein
MPMLLASNILEHPGFFDFVAETLPNQRSGSESSASLLITGDLLNIFPEPGEDLLGSIYCEIFGDMIVPEMERLVTTRFQHIEQSAFIEPLRSMFLPTGAAFNQAQEKARQRYQVFFQKLNRALDGHDCYFIPGNMDYPFISASLLGDSSQNSLKIHQLDCQVVEIDRVPVGGLGGIPNTAHPFRHVVEISPYEMTETEYQRRLQSLWGVEVLMTHLSPEEYPPLLDFLHNSPLKLLICRAPFNFRRASDFRGKLELQTLTDHPGKSIIQVRPFDFPKNQAFWVDLAAGCRTGDWHNALETVDWLVCGAISG